MPTYTPDVIKPIFFLGTEGTEVHPILTEATATLPLLGGRVDVDFTIALDVGIKQLEVDASLVANLCTVTVELPDLKAASRFADMAQVVGVLPALRAAVGLEHEKAMTMAGELRLVVSADMVELIQGRMIAGIPQLKVRADVQSQSISTVVARLEKLATGIVVEQPTAGVVTVSLPLLSVSGTIRPTMTIATDDQILRY